jgi:dTDP-4-amino-4,6-dideoxygalactose transaminase
MTAHASDPGSASSPVPLLDVARQYQALRKELLRAIEKVCDSGRFVLGPDCEELERRLAEYCGVPHAVSCASGSDALLLALMAYGVGPGHEVLMPSYTFFATAGAAWRLGARPVFVDIDPAT